MFKYLVSILAALLLAGTAQAVLYTSQGSIVLRASGAGGGDTTGGYIADATFEFVNDGRYCGYYLYIDVTDEEATASLSISTQIVDLEGNGAATVLGAAFTAIEAVGEFIYLSHPVESTTTNVNAIENMSLPYRFNIFFDHNDADEFTYGASIHFVDCW